jgi:hypothetical protein
MGNALVVIDESIADGWPAESYPQTVARKSRHLTPSPLPKSALAQALSGNRHVVSQDSALQFPRSACGKYYEQAHALRENRHCPDRNHHYLNPGSLRKQL